MPTIIDGSAGVNKVQDASVVQADLAANVVGNGLGTWTASAEL